ncbi:MAG: SOS response-associated peptidase [Firmicutes bacterium HGW-Firmicutes-9]|jgi:putative SOS response-associated peptidase YedK|nr:MAG: SOS response-associated peptidase [Firmicutes bacterium HGW-Firmicutes-9]
MCGRFYTDFDDEQYREMLALLYLKSELDAGLLMLKNGEVFPTDTVAALDAAGPRAMRWGFARFDGKGKVINARSETALEKNMFRAPMMTNPGLPQTGRCLIPASGYFEWETRENQKIKYKLRPAKEGLFTFAGLYRSEVGQDTPVFVILTAPASGGISFIHDRMPLILTQEQREAWLNDPTSAGKLLEEGVQDIVYEPAS